MENAAPILKEESRYVRAIRCEISKPLVATWDEVGSVLRKQRAVIHRLLNAAVLACIDAHRKILNEAPQTAAYRAVNAELKSFTEWAAAHKDPQVRGLADLNLPGGTVAAISSLANDAFLKWRKERGNVGIPSFKRGQPIPIRQQECRIERDPLGFVFACKLEGGRGTWERFALAGSRGKHDKTLRQLVDPETGVCPLAAKLDYDDRKKKWFLILSYSAPVVKTALDPERVLAVHRGKYNFLYMLSSENRGTSLHGGKLLRFKQNIRARRTSSKKIRNRERGGGSKGHGTSRRYEFNEALSHAEARFVDTFSKQAAARVRELATAWGCGKVLIGDYGGIEASEERGERMYVERFPFHRLKLDIKNALEPVGITFEEVSESYVSQTCPECGHAEASSVNRRTGIFHCRGAGCDFSRPADHVSAVHMLRRAGHGQNADRALSEEKALVKALRKKGKK